MTLRTISYGGGVQSSALCVLATQGRLGQVDAALFSNVGDDSEHPATLDYVRNVMQPWAAERGLRVHELRRGSWPTGDPKTLLSYLEAYNGCQSCGATFEDECFPSCTSSTNTGGDLPIPVKIIPSLAPVARSCTNHWKIGPIRSWLIAHGATPQRPAEILIGISVEIGRAHV